jgi:hypothetical protein
MDPQHKVDSIDLAVRVKDMLLARGPMTGVELSEALPDVSPISLWRTCYGTYSFRVQNCARYYLRYDILRGNQLRLSPSILRDFLTFSLVHLPDQRVAVVEAGTRLANKFRSISLRKLGRARQALLKLPIELQDEINAHCVVFLSGDIAYYLAHDTPRVHAQLRTPLNGSDIDIVIVTNREACPDKVARIEAELLKVKKIFLLAPSIREEIDFIVKPIETMLEQLSYGDIHEKIASKILYESYFLMGRTDIYESLIQNMGLRGTRAQIEADFEIALSERKSTIRKILELPPEASVEDPEVASLFFASQERLEFR